MFKVGGKPHEPIVTTYTGDPMPVVREMKLDVSYGEQNAKLSPYVVVGQGPSLMAYLVLV